MSGRYLYCLDCNEYLGASGGDSCHGCGWEAPHEREPTEPTEPTDEMVDAALAAVEWRIEYPNKMPTRDQMRAALRAAMGVAK